MTRPPRIYLDTALLIDRADGKVSQVLIDRFDAAVVRSGAQTVIAVSHLWDIHASANPGARDRTIATIDLLPNLRIVVVNPPQIEKPRIDAVMLGQSVEDAAPDIALGVVSDLSAVVAEVTSGFFALAEAGKGMAEGGNTSRTAPAAKGSDVAVADFIRRFVSGESLSDLLRTAAKTDDALGSVSALLAALRPIEEQGRAMLQQELARVGGDPLTLVRVLRTTGGSPADLAWSSTKGGEQGWYEAAKRYGPGMYVSKKLSKRRASDQRRSIKPSDLADVDHVMHLPYMDLATVDNENHDAVQRAIRELVPPGAVRLFRNGDFVELVEALERLPDGAA